MNQTTNAAAFEGLVDLAAGRVGGRALAASDEFFAGKENLLLPGRGIYLPEKFTAKGKWMDGWETRRKRSAGHDWCIIRLGLPGKIRGVDIDTNHFLGNNPSYASIEACAIASGAGKDPARIPADAWTEILPRSPLRPGAQNLFGVASSGRWTHLRLNIFPDGGVARLKVYGEVVPDASVGRSKVPIDLAAVGSGGAVVAASDMFFGSKENLIMPGRAANMGDGWETCRRRGPGHDWAVVRLGYPGTITQIEVDTNHFKGNYPDRCTIEVCHARGAVVDALTCHDLRWKEILPVTKLHAHRRHLFARQLGASAAVTHVRLNIFPDGGVSRLRIWGVPSAR